jgi:hypothetical protein
MAVDKPDPDKKQYLSVNLTVGLISRIRAAVWHTMHQPGEAPTVSEWARNALLKDVLRLERKYNGGEPFPSMDGRPLPRGPRAGLAAARAPRKKRAAAKKRT